MNAEIGLPEPKLAVQVIKTVRRCLGLSCPATIGPDSRFRHDLKCDSLHMVEIPMAIEDKFDIILTDDEVSALTTVDDLVRLVHTKQVSS